MRLTAQVFAPFFCMEIFVMLPRFVIAVHNPALREELRRFLALRGFDVVVSANGLQCIERLQEGLPTVLVLDPHIQWGGGDGVLDWLQKEAPFTNVTVVLANGGNYDDIPQRLHSLIDDCHQCPGSLHDLQQFIACLEQHAWRLSSEPLQSTGHIGSPS